MSEQTISQEQHQSELEVQRQYMYDVIQDLKEQIAGLAEQKANVSAKLSVANKQLTQLQQALNKSNIVINVLQNENGQLKELNNNLGKEVDSMMKQKINTAGPVEVPKLPKERKK